MPVCRWRAKGGAARAWGAPAAQPRPSFPFSQLAALAAPALLAAGVRAAAPRTRSKQAPASPWPAAHAAAALGLRSALAAGAPLPARAGALAAYVALTVATLAVAPPDRGRGAAVLAGLAAVAVASFEGAAPGASLWLLPLVAWASFATGLVAVAGRGPAARVAGRWAGVRAAGAPASPPSPPSLPAARRPSMSSDHEPHRLAPPGTPASGSMLPGSFADPGAAGFRVRGRSYAVDRVKFAPPATRARLAAVELVATAAPTQHISRLLPSIHSSSAPFTFVWHVLVPGRPSCVSLVCAWSLEYCPVARVGAAVEAARARGATTATLADVLAPPPGTDGAAGATVERSASSATEFGAPPAAAPAPSGGHRRAATAAGPDADALAAAVGSPAPRPHRGSETAASVAAATAGVDAFDLALARFVAAGGAAAGPQPAGAAARAAAFKVIPRVDVGSWVVKSAVGQNTPVLLGKKVATSYFRGPRYLEVAVDVGSSRTAARVVGLVQGALRGLEISIAVVLEGRAGDELPEALLGTVRLSRVDLSRAPKL